MQADKTIKVLIVSKEEDAAVRILNALRREGYHPQWQQVNSREELAGALASRDWDAIIAEAEVKESRELYRLLLQNANDAVYVHDITPDAPGRILQANEQASRMLGYSNEELLSMRIIDLDVPEQLPRIPAIIDTLLLTGGALFETEHLHKEGHRVPVEVSTRIFKFRNRPVVLSIVRDISERKRAEQGLAESFGRLRKAMQGIIQVIAQTVEARDPYTAGHQRRVSDLARAIAQELGLSSDTVDGIRTTGLIHDLGKVAIPGEILSKPAQLNDLEYSLIKTHVQAAVDILRDVAFPWPVAEMIHQHHERLDGSGYPRGLRGSQIMPEARILAVADVVESMVSHRPYRPAFGLEVAMEEISLNRGLLYDAQVVDACLNLFQHKGFQLKN